MAETKSEQPVTPQDPAELGDGVVANTTKDAGDDDISAAVYRAAVERADEAEDACDAMKAKIAELEAQLAAAHEALDHAERRHQIDLMLAEADAIDLETARLLVELGLPNHEGSPEKAVEAIRQSKPYLFRSGLGGVGGGVGGSDGMRGIAMGAALGTMSADPELTITDAGMRLIELAEEAAQHGDRRALLRYLQARRSG